MSKYTPVFRSPSRRVLHPAARVLPRRRRYTAAKIDDAQETNCPAAAVRRK
jgi:hypothetical protein